MSRRVATVTSPLYCQEAKQLLNAFGDVVQDLIRLHEQQFQSVMRGELDSTRFDDLIHMANERKQQAKYAYMKHLETHGCSTYDASNKD